MLCGVSSRFQLLSPCMRQVTHALLTRPPLSWSKASFQSTPFDLHVLGTPPAFILSQDQTLKFKFVSLTLFRTRWPLVCGHVSVYCLLGNLSCICTLVRSTCRVLCSGLSTGWNFGIFKVVSLFDYQGSSCLEKQELSAFLMLRFAVSSIIITPAFWFVNTFFKKFFKFFQLLKP